MMMAQLRKDKTSAAPAQSAIAAKDQPVPAAYEIAPPGGRQTGQSKEKVHEGDVSISVTMEPYHRPGVEQPLI
jgi:hypothetical protein